MIAVLLAAALLGRPGSAFGDGGPASASWSLMREVDGVRAWGAELAGDFWGFARGTVEARPEAVFARVVDFDTMPERYPWLDRVRVLDRSDDTALVHFHYDFPWPLADRSYTARYRWWREPSGTIVVQVEDANEPGAPADGTVRVERVFGRFTFTPAPPGESTVVEYLFRADVAGMLPHVVRAETPWKVPLNFVLSLRRVFDRPRTR